MIFRLTCSVQRKRETRKKYNSFPFHLKSKLVQTNCTCFFAFNFTGFFSPSFANGPFTYALLLFLSNKLSQRKNMLFLKLLVCCRIRKTFFYFYSANYFNYWGNSQKNLIPYKSVRTKQSYHPFPVTLVTHRQI